MQGYFGPGPRAGRFPDHGRAPEYCSYIGNITISPKNGKVAFPGDCLEKFKVDVRCALRTSGGRDGRLVHNLRVSQRLMRDY